jgi:hypothetical protein
MSESARRIVDLNIKHYRELLNTELDRTKLAVLAKLPTERVRLKGGW